MTDLLRALEEQKQQTKQEVPEITGMLGIPLGGQRRVEVPNRNRYVYVRLRSNQNEVIQAFNDKVAPSYNLPVVLERDGNRYTVVKQDSKRYDNNHNSTSPFLPRHGNTHSFDTESGGGGDVVWVYPRQFMPSLVLPSGSSGADNVIAASYMLRKNDGSWRHVGNTGTASFTPYKPSSPTGAVMGLVYLDESSGNPYFLINSGSVFSASLTGTSQVAPFIPSVPSPSTQIPLAAIRLVTGTSVLSWDNIYDVRQFIHTVPTGSSGGGASTGTNYDDIYFRLDATNDPITGPTDIIFTGDPGSWGIRVFTTQASPMQFTHAITGSGQFEDSSILMVRTSSPGGAGLAFEDAIIRVSQFLNAEDTDQGGLLKYTSQGTERVIINPSVQGTGTMVMFDSDASLNDDANLLLLKHQGNPKFKVNALGHIELGLGIPKEPNAGKIGYELVAPGGYLDIIGAGTTTPRWVRIYDRLRVEHGQLQSLQVLGLTDSWVYLNATGTAVAPNNAPTKSLITGSDYVLGLNSESSFASVKMPVSKVTPTQINGVSTLASDFEITASSGVFEDSGLGITLPEAGTYFIAGSIRGALRADTANSFIAAKLRNTTDSVDIANTETLVIFMAPASTLGQNSVAMTALVTVSSSKTIKLFVSRNSTGAFTVSFISSNANGRSRLQYTKIA